LFAGLLMMAGCSKITKITDSITNPSARVVYERGAEKHMLYGQWNAAYTGALADSLQVKLPYVENGTFQKNNVAVYSYTLQSVQGEVISAHVERDSTHHQVFIDLFEETPQGFRHIKALDPIMPTLEFAIEKSGTYKIVVQPEILAQTDFNIVLTKKP